MQPQGLCMCSRFCLECYSSRLPVTLSTLAFRSQSKCFFTEAPLAITLKKTHSYPLSYTPLNGLCNAYCWLIFLLFIYSRMYLWFVFTHWNANSKRAETWHRQGLEWRLSCGRSSSDIGGLNEYVNVQRLVFHTLLRMCLFS